MEIPRAILSDSDGTLVDTLHLIRHGLYETSKSYFESLGIPDQDIPAYEAFEEIANQSVGGSPRHTLETAARLLYEHQPHHIERMDFNQLEALLDPIQDAIAPEFVKPYDGLSNLLRFLGEKGIMLAIFSSGTPHQIVRNIGVALPEVGMSTLFRNTAIDSRDKLDTFTTRVKEYYGLPDFTIVTSADTNTHKPNPEGINLAMNRLGVAASESAVFGDHKVDMQAGVNAFVPQRIGVTHGFNDRVTLEEAGATFTIDSLLGLIQLLS